MAIKDKLAKLGLLVDNIYEASLVSTSHATHQTLLIGEILSYCLAVLSTPYLTHI